jgi:hypothetical protein
VGVQVARSETEDLNTSARVRDEWEANHWAPYGDGFDVHVPDTPPFADLGLTERQARDVIDTITDACASLIVTLTGLPGDEVTQALADWDGRPAEDDYSYSEHRLAWLTALAKRPSGQNSTVA